MIDDTSIHAGSSVSFIDRASFFLMMLTMNSCLPVILIAVAVASPCAAADDDTRLKDSPVNGT